MQTLLARRKNTMQASLRAVSVQPSPIKHFPERPVAKDELLSAVRKGLKLT